jgi:phosphatidylethanolamine-binding protein (PEBP) family uncharacterized protein
LQLAWAKGLHAVGAGLPAAAWGGESITAYFGPAPGQGSGRHRYALAAYAQLPYEACTAEQYAAAAARLKPLALAAPRADNEAPDAFCDADSCARPL